MQWRPILGIVGGSLILLSAVPHALAGWPHIQQELGKIDASDDLVETLRIGWLLGTMAMVAFGLQAIVPCVQRLRGQSVQSLPLWLVAGAYGGYGLWALVVSGFEPNFLVFVVPALLVAIAAPAGKAPEPRE